MTSSKIHRWIDLLAALLSRRLPATFTDLARDVPGYARPTGVAAGQPTDTQKRMFERDKLELRGFGVPIETVGDDGDDEAAYQLKAKDFYLPYLAVAGERGVQAPARVTRWGYASLATLAFEPDELDAIADGARRAMAVGDATLTDDARHAIRKLAFDLPLGVTDGADAADVMVPSRSGAAPRMLAMLGDALFRRKRVTLSYHGMGTDAGVDRDVEPYGLFFVSGHWYLAARDASRDAMRNFRVSRMSSVKVNAKKAGTADYEIPASFTLREHARSRQAWELGDGDAFEAVVRFRGETGAVLAAQALGRPDAVAPRQRRFSVRRSDAFARWLLAFGGEAVPVEPASLVDEYHQLVERTRSVYRPKVQA